MLSIIWGDKLYLNFVYIIADILSNKDLSYSSQTVIVCSSIKFYYLCISKVCSLCWIRYETDNRGGNTSVQGVRIGGDYIGEKTTIIGRCVVLSLQLWFVSWSDKP